MYMYVLMYSIVLMVPYDLYSWEKHSFKVKGVGVDAA